MVFRIFLAGFIDSDGSIQPYVKYRGKTTKRLYFESGITISESNRELLELLSHILSIKYGITSNVRYGFDGAYRLRINSIESVCKTIELVISNILNIERRPKAYIIKYYYEDKFTDLNKVRTIYNKLREQQKRMQALLVDLVKLMTEKQLKIVITQEKIIVVPQHFNYKDAV